MSDSDTFDITRGDPEAEPSQPAPVAARAVGQTIGRYTITAKLGEGAMGVVYKAFDPQLNRPVALKFIGQSTLINSAGYVRFQNEAKAAAAIDHPNVCTIYDIGTEAGEIYFAMAYVDGHSLKERILKGPLGFEEAGELCIQAALGLHAAHEHHVVHRDVKPNNLMITRGGVIKIVDFGVALLPEIEGQALGWAGTPAYMSPQQSRGEQVDHRTDVWSLGITLYEMIFGAHPFKGPDLRALLHSIANDHLSWPRAAERDGLSRLEPVVRRALAKDIHNRYPTALDMAADLKTIAASSVFTGSAPDDSCIAVFPFANLGGNEQATYFSDGLTDELINALAQVDGLRVVSRTSVFEFKGKPMNIRSFGEQLHATAVLEGSVRSADKRIRVTVQLTNVADGFHLWSERFDRELHDIFEIQDEITGAIIEKLKVRYSHEKKVPAAKKSPRAMEAYDLYLNGKYQWNSQSEEGFQKAVHYFEQAIEHDPTLAVAHAGLADAFTFLGFHGLMPSRAVFPKARVAAERALEIDKSLPEANIAIGFVKLFHDWEWEGAERYLRRAIELNPSSAKAYYALTICTVQLGRFSQGRAAIQRAIELDPLNVIYHTSAGWVEYYAKRPRVAVEMLQKALGIDANYTEIQVALGASYEQLGMHADAAECFKRAVSVYGEHPLVLAFMASNFGSAGQTEDAEKILTTLDRISATRFVPSACRAIVYMGLRNTEKTLEHLELAAEARDAFLCWMNVLPLSAWLLQEPRFVDLLSRIGFHRSTTAT